MLDVGGLGLIEARVDGVEGWHEVRKILVYGTDLGLGMVGASRNCRSR